MIISAAIRIALDTPIEASNIMRRRQPESILEIRIKHGHKDYILHALRLKPNKVVPRSSTVLKYINISNLRRSSTKVISYKSAHGVFIGSHPTALWTTLPLFLGTQLEQLVCMVWPRQMHLCCGRDYIEHTHHSGCMY